MQSFSLLQTFKRLAKRVAYQMRSGWPPGVQGAGAPWLAVKARVASPERLVKFNVAVTDELMESLRYSLSSDYVYIIFKG